MKLFMRVVFMIASDIYRMAIKIKDLFIGERIDVAYITNFQNDVERGFMGFSSLFREKLFTYALRLRLGDKVVGQYIAINSIAKDLVKDPTTRNLGFKGLKARTQVLAAIEELSKKGARVVLFAASTKRLFDRSELEEISKEYPNMTFTIGDNGTAIELLRDVFDVINRKGISKSDKIMVIGPNGFLGKVVRESLEKVGYHNLITVSQRNKDPFDFGGVRMVIACSHHRNVRINRKIIEKISHEEGLYVVDVCRPYNFSKREFRSCLENGVNVERRDSGNTFNKFLKYDVPLIATVALKQLGLSENRLFGCFSEATALAAVDRDKLQAFDFLSINGSAIKFVKIALDRAHFTPSPVCNFGIEIDNSEQKKGKISSWKVSPEFARTFASLF